MGQVQEQLEKYHSQIRIDFDHSETLREKRDIVCKLISDYLSKNSLPAFNRLLQGSYKMKTGVKPIGDLEYDIDIGLRWLVDRSEYKPEVLRSWIFEAVDGHTKDVHEKGPCVRVVYSKGFHLDLVAYAVEDSRYWLAHRDRDWVPADPVKLLDFVKAYRHERFAETLDHSKTDQFRRVVRYLRRWNDGRFPTEHSEKPCGLVFVLLAISKGLQPCFDFEGYPDDLLALESFLDMVCSTSGRLKVHKPTPEYEDLLEGLDEDAMGRLKSAFENLREIVRAARETADPIESCKILSRVFVDFPVPTVTESAKTSGFPAVVPSSHSGCASPSA